jgi:hypothetical protein
MKSLLKTTFRPLLAIASLAVISCSTNVDMPKGTSKGYTSARLVQRNPNLKADTATQTQVHQMIQKSIASQFTSHGLTYGKSNAELTVAYLVIYQEPGMTARYEDYFGYGRSTEEIADLAHTRGVIDNKNPDYFKRAGIVVDVIDSSTNKLVYRNFAAGDVVTGASDGTRAARINTVVGQALEPFFGK